MNYAFAYLGLIRKAKKNGISPILWKGVDRVNSLDDPVSDLDILVRNEEWDRMVELLRQCGYIRLNSASWRSIADVDDYFGHDSVTAKVLHVQLYRSLVLGSAAATQLRLHRTDVLYENLATGTASDGINVLQGSNAAMASVLRMSRALLLSNLKSKQRAEYLSQAKSLAAECGQNTVVKVAADMFDARLAETFGSLLTDKPVIAEAGNLLKSHSSTDHLTGSWPNRLLSIASGINRRFFHWPILPRRILQKHAPTVVVLGSDGSGKSTLSKYLYETLNQKIDARHIYFGTGDGSSAFYRKPFVAMRYVLDKVSRKQIVEEPDNASNAEANAIEVSGAGGSETKYDTSARKDRSVLHLVARGLWAVSVAFERRGKIRRLRRSSKRGFIVVTDRFPQASHPGIHDGPRLGHWRKSGSRLRCLLAEWEHSVYADLASQQVDLVLFLDVDPELAKQRRPEETMAELEKRVAIIREISIPANRHVRIDASLPLNEVRDIAMKELFAILTDRPEEDLDSVQVYSGQKNDS